MNRMSLSNIFADIGFEQFRHLTSEFILAFEGHDTSNEITLDVCLLDKLPLISSFIEDEEIQKYIDGFHDDATIVKTGSIADLNQTAWNQSAYAVITVRDTSNHYWGQIEFKGKQAKTATYYLQAKNGSAILENINRDHPLMFRGDGFGRHCY
ncbi:MAG: hypothetical protein HY370_09950 [Proteobacteria bacterium]|nr:hypothetical protein [Pseudomonadota bacterium]